MDFREVSICLKRVQQGKQLAVDAALSDLGCSFSQWVLLDRISAFPGASAHQLAQAAFQTDQSFGSLARRLIDRDLVKRKPGRGRATMHTLTPQGERLLVQCNPLVMSTLRQHFSALTAEEFQQFGALLQKIMREPVSEQSSSGKAGSAREVTP